MPRASSSFFAVGDAVPARRTSSFVAPSSFFARPWTSVAAFSTLLACSRPQPSPDYDRARHLWTTQCVTRFPLPRCMLMPSDGHP